MAMTPTTAAANETLEVQQQHRLSWGAILAGAFVALGLMALLYLFGLAVGLTTVDQSPKSAGIWMAVWMLVLPIVSLFCGGWVAGHYCGLKKRMAAAVHGAVAWGFAMVIGIVVAGTAMWAAMSGVAAVGGAVGSVAGAAISGLSGANLGQAAQSLGINTQDLLEPINQQRQAQGLPPLSAENLQAAIKDAVNTSLQEGKVNREILVSALVDNTAISQQEANQLAAQIEGQVSQLGGSITQGAQTALNTVTWVVWVAFFAALLSLAAAAGGAMLGVSRRQRRPLVAEPVRTVPPTPTPAGRPAEVYP